MLFLLVKGAFDDLHRFLPDFVPILPNLSSLLSLLDGKGAVALNELLHRQEVDILKSLS